MMKMEKMQYGYLNSDRQQYLETDFDRIYRMNNVKK